MHQFDARKWYLSQEENIPSHLDSSQPLSAQARQAFDLRNKFRLEARELMEDRISADRLNREELNLTWDGLLAKTSGKLENRGISNPTMDQIYQEIIKSSHRSRQSVNKSLGLLIQLIRSLRKFVPRIISVMNTMFLVWMIGNFLTRS